MCFTPLEEHFDINGAIPQDRKTPKRQNRHRPLPLGLPTEKLFGQREGNHEHSSTGG